MFNAQAKNEFIELKVEEKSDKKVDNSTKTLDIVLVQSIPPSKLPYADIYTQDKLAEIKAERFNQCMILARGDSRSITAISYAGGFHPQYTNPETKLAKQGKDILDVIQHRRLVEGSGLVSFTSDIEVAKNFSVGEEKGFVYFVKVTGAIGPSPMINHQESEFSVPGGVDAKNIVAFRALNSQIQDIEDIMDNDTDVSEVSFSGSSIYISRQFIKDYPDRVGDLIDSILQKNERCVDKDNVIKSIIQEEPSSSEISALPQKNNS